MAKQYNRVMLGRGGQFSEECLKGGYIGADFNIPGDLTPKLTNDWRKFNQHYVSIFLANNPTKNVYAAGQSCGALWTIACGLQNKDIVLCPRGNGEYLIGEVNGNYFYAPGTDLPHRRPIKWYNKVILRSDMSDNLKHSTGSIGTCCKVDKYATEIDNLIANKSKPLATNQPVAQAPKTKQSMSKGLQFDEIDLHKIFCTYLRDLDLKIYGKTINHQKSTNKSNDRKWIHPDIIGVRFSKINNEPVKNLLNKVDTDKSIRLYSFEMKKEIHSDNELKQCYFQAVSNSSWAHKGYLVAFEIDDDLKEEMARLNAAFGIGIIRLHAHSADTELLFEARENEIDYTTLDNLCDNPDAGEFIEKLSLYLEADSKGQKVFWGNFEKDCDEIFKDDQELDKYCISKSIPLD